MDEKEKSGLKPVADAMRRYCVKADCRFALMAGDNIYPNGAAGDARDTELFRSRFVEPFGPLADGKPNFRYYIALGNHDWYSSRAGALAQVTFHEKTSPFYMDGLFYSVKPPELDGQVEVFVVDTEMLLAPVTVPGMKALPDGSMESSGKTQRAGGKNALPQNEAERGQLAWLERALANSKAKWKLVLGHHPLWQSRPDSKYAQSIALRKLLLPILCRHADAYFAGHQHDLELQTDTCGTSNIGGEVRPLPNVVSGAGAKSRSIGQEFPLWQQRNWPQLQQIWASGSNWGFAHVTLAGDRMEVRMMTVAEDGSTQEAFRHSFAERPDVDSVATSAPTVDSEWITGRPIGDLQSELESGRWSSERLAAAYFARIAALDRAGPVLGSIIVLNPDAIAQARTLDAERTAGKVRGPLHGIPLLFKDNIETLDRMATTAGSLALKDNITGRDSPLVAKLRAAGAVILGKTNLSEWANLRSDYSTSGWSAAGGLVRNPYALDRSVCGSSSGSAAAVSASLAAGAVGTETDGSITCPASMTGIVGYKPTVGLVSRRFIVPISHSQDTAGPMTRSVKDAAIMLTAMAGFDAGDPATAEADKHKMDYAAALDVGALKGKRLGVMRFATGFHPEVDATFEASLKTLREAGAVLVDIVEFPNRAEMKQNEHIVIVTELKSDLNNYLSSTPSTVRSRSLAQLIAFNNANAAAEMPLFGQDSFIEAEATKGVGDQVYKNALATSRRLAGVEGIDKILTEHNLDALVAPTRAPAFMIDVVNGDHSSGGGAGSPPAIAGYPHLTVPMGLIKGLPVGMSFIGPAWSDALVLSLGYAFEMKVQITMRPTFARSADIFSPVLESSTHNRSH